MDLYQHSNDIADAITYMETLTLSITPEKIAFGVSPMAEE